jgi:hypothetical protein
MCSTARCIALLPSSFLTFSPKAKPACVFHQEMHLIGRHHVVQYGQTEPLLRAEQLEQSEAVERLEPFEQTSAAAVSDMPEVTGQKAAVGAQHRFSSYTAVSEPKSGL